MTRVSRNMPDRKYGKKTGYMEGRYNFHLDDPFPTGKYKGKTIREIIDNHLYYWKKVLENKSFPADVMKYTDEALKRFTQYQKSLLLESRKMEKVTSKNYELVTNDI